MRQPSDDGRGRYSVINFGATSSRSSAWSGNSTPAVTATAMTVWTYWENSSRSSEVVLIDSSRTSPHGRRIFSRASRQSAHHHEVNRAAVQPNAASPHLS